MTLTRAETTGTTRPMTTEEKSIQRYGLYEPELGVFLMAIPKRDDEKMRLMRAMKWGKIGDGRIPVYLPDELEYLSKYLDGGDTSGMDMPSLVRYVWIPNISCFDERDTWVHPSWLELFGENGVPELMAVPFKDGGPVYGGSFRV